MVSFERECVQFFSEVVHIFGVPRSVGQIYGLLYASPQPLSFSHIVERLEISKGSGSQGLQLLRSLGAIKVANLSDNESSVSNSSQSAMRVSRAIAYQPEMSLRRLVSGVLQERIAPMTATGTERLARMRELAEEGGRGCEFYLDRAKQLNTWRRRVKTILPILAALLGSKK